jgi:hypothetical protein
MPRFRQPSRTKGQQPFDLAPGKDTGSSKEKYPEAENQPTPITPAEEKIGEGDENLRARENAFKRRRGTTR